ncbi:MAG TPA: hypothetical protein VFN51_01275, partial [Candidatus Saccharimonadales bacterium]|nr:hypothetical protein [Candidatus Saccharimonadales bacterium]
PQPTLSDDNPTESFTAYNIIIDLNINGLSQDDTQAAQSFYEAINRFYSIEKEEGELNKDGASIKKTTVWSMFVTDDLEQDPLEAPYQEVKFDISYNEGLTWQGVTSELDKLIRLRFALTVKSLKGITDQSTIDQIAALDSEIAKIENEKRNFETQLGLKPEGEYDQNEHAALMDIVNSVHRALDIQEN